MSLGHAAFRPSTSATAPAVDAADLAVELLANGEVAFARILRRIDEAHRSILVRSFNWRDDETGESVARALLRAADRGVKVTILKDRVGMHYEYLEGSKQSFFHKRIALRVRLQTWFLMVVYGQWGSLRQRPSLLAQAVLTHPNITVRWEQERFDHAKVYVVDDQSVILGGMGIGDDSRLENVDFMVEVSGTDAALRLNERHEGRVAFDPDRRFDYLLHSFVANGDSGDTLAAQRLRLIRAAQKSVTIAMAYMGDRACAKALVEAVNRGVRVTLLTSARANVLGDLNLRTCDHLLRRTGNAPNLRVFLHPRMVHGKAVVVDGARVDIGSANFTCLSHGGYEEVNLYCQDPVFARAVEAAIEHNIADSQAAHHPVPHRKVSALIERALSAYQAGRSR
jgi:cardiolipin synthase